MTVAHYDLRTLSFCALDYTLELLFRIVVFPAVHGEVVASQQIVESPLPWSMARREDLRNVAIVAHVDHGKTTLVDAMLWQSGSFRENQDVDERVMDSIDLEREKGITILAKNTASSSATSKINIVDTPGHADFGGEVERGLTMVDGVLLLVDASEGPLPQTRFVLRKALEAQLPVVLVVNKVDRPDARIEEVVDEVYELFLDLDADEKQIEFPIVYANARAGHAGARRPTSSRRDLEPALRHAARDGPGADLRPGPSAAGARHEPRRVARTSAASRCCRIHHGTLRKGAQIAWCRADGTIETARVTELYITEALDRVPADEAGPGRHRRARRAPRGDDRRDDRRPRRPAPAAGDDRRRAVALGHDRHQHEPARRHTRATASPRARSRTGSTQELVGNVSLRVLPTARPDAWEVQGRGELQLAVLVELMRREGFELTVGKPRGADAARSTASGTSRSSASRSTSPRTTSASSPSCSRSARAALQQMVNHGTGWARMEYLVPARGLIGFRTEFLTETRGTGILHHVFDGVGAVARRAAHAADRQPRRRPARHGDGVRDLSLQERGSLFVGPGDRALRGHDRRRELARRRPGRQRDEAEEAHEHARRRPPTSSCG